jgi:protein-S-isoprenylcysteine O-methyltransferase Ste14
MDEDPSLRPDAGASAAEERSAAQATPSTRPSRAHVLGVQAVELVTFAVAVIGALALGLGITDYLSDHLEVLAYLTAYAGFRVAQILMTAEPSQVVDLVKACSGSMGDLPAALLFAAAPFERTYAYAAEGEAPMWSAAAGLIIGLIGFWIALVAQMQIDRAAESAQAALDGQPLIRTGLFRYVRHPSYAGQSLAWIGWPLIYGAPVTALVMLVGGALIVRRRIRADEARMLERFGDEYAAYMGVSERVIPGVW